MEHVDLVGGKHDARRQRGADQRPAETGIEGDEFLDRHLGELGGELHVDVAQLRIGGEIGRIGDRIEDDAEQRRVGNDVLQRLQLGDVHARFGGHFQVRVVRRLARGAVLGDRPRHPVLAQVIGGERELPVAVQLVEPGEVVERRGGRVDDVAAPVVPPVLLQLEAPAGARDELPQARGVRARVGHRVERALDHRQQRQLGRQAALFDLLDDVIEVQPAAVEDALQVFGARGEVRGVLLHQGTVEVRDREALANALPEIRRPLGAIDLPQAAQRLLHDPLLALEGRQAGRVGKNGRRQRGLRAHGRRRG